MDFDKPFADYMALIMPEVEKFSPEYWICFEAWLGGVGHGITIPGEECEGVAERLTSAFQRADNEYFAALISQHVPEEFRIRFPDGRLAVSELGVIHLTTRLEQARPEDAKRLRAVRYQLVQMMREHQATNPAAEQGGPGDV